MKLQNALESFKSGDAPAVLAEIYSILLRVLYPPPAPDHALADLGYAAAMGDCSTPWPAVESGARAQSSRMLRSTASCAARSPCRRRRDGSGRALASQKSTLREGGRSSA
jgi:hypothetical protein